MYQICKEFGCLQPVTWIRNPKRNSNELRWYKNKTDGLTSTVSYPILRSEYCYWHHKQRHLKESKKSKQRTSQDLFM